MATANLANIRPFTANESLRSEDSGLYLSPYEQEIEPGDHCVVNGQLEASVLPVDYTLHLLKERLEPWDVAKLRGQYGQDLRVAALVASRLEKAPDGRRRPIYDFMIVDGGMGTSHDAALIYIRDQRLDVGGRAGAFDESGGVPTNILPLNLDHPIRHIWNPKTRVNRLTVGLNTKGDYYLATPNLLTTEAVGGRYREYQLGQSVYVETPRVDWGAEMRAKLARKFGPIITRLAGGHVDQRAA